MPEYLAPGVYVKEIDGGPKPIEGVTTSTAAFLGETERGPLKPQFVTSYSQYLRMYGDVFGQNKYMPYAVKAFFDNGGQRCYIARIIGQDAGIAELNVAGMKIKAVGPGQAYTRVWITISAGTTHGTINQPTNFRLQVFYWADGNTEITDPALGDQANSAWTTVEYFDNLSVDPDSASYFERQINNGNSSYIEVTPENTDNPVPLPTTEISARLASQVKAGRDPIASDYVGAHENPASRTGLSALDLDEFEAVAIVYAPNADVSTARSVITHCENSAFRFAVIDCPSGVTDEKLPKPREDIQDSQYAAYYYPWLWVSNPQSGTRTLVPPGGAVCGIYARTDNTRGVFKSPANQPVVGAIKLETQVNRATQRILNPRSVNVIRSFPGRGIRVWGARTLSGDPEWKYISVRRLVIFLENSIYRSTQWVNFEPNDSHLWWRVQVTITNFLQTQWREGALNGAREKEAFFVKAGHDTMTLDDIRNGRLVIEIGVAPIRPAQFVIFRVNQKTVEAM